MQQQAEILRALTTDPAGSETGAGVLPAGGEAAEARVARHPRGGGSAGAHRVAAVRRRARAPRPHR
eukprot:761153-Prorocentrum_minimum.AAC.1